MKLIDDEGNLFGKINVIDALVILLVLAVAVAGIALVVPSSDDTETDTDSETNETDTDSEINETSANESELATRYVTLDLGTHPSYIAESITTGDTMERDGHNLTVTDVYSAPTDADTEAVTIRAELEGELSEDTPQFKFAGNGLRVGDTLSVETEEYVTEGSIQQFDESGSGLQTEDITLEITLTDVDQDIAAGIDEGMTRSSRGESLITVESVTTESTSDDEDTTNKDVSLTVELRTVETVSGYRFSGSPLRIGDSIMLDLGTVTVEGTVSDLTE